MAIHITIRMSRLWHFICLFCSCCRLMVFFLVSFVFVFCYFSLELGIVPLLSGPKSKLRRKKRTIVTTKQNFCKKKKIYVYKDKIIDVIFRSVFLAAYRFQCSTFTQAYVLILQGFFSNMLKKPNESVSVRVSVNSLCVGNSCEKIKER